MDICFPIYLFVGKFVQSDTQYVLPNNASAKLFKPHAGARPLSSSRT